jgi:hypothetical protein
MAKSGKQQRRLSDGYSFAGIRARAGVRGVFGDPDVRIVRLDRRSKKPSADAAGTRRRAGTTDGYGTFAICRVPDFGLFWNWKCVAWRAGVVAP